MCVSTGGGTITLESFTSFDCFTLLGKFHLCLGLEHMDLNSWETESGSPND